MSEDPPSIPENYECTLRSANAALNMGMALAVVAAAVYALWGRGEEVREWQVWICGVGAIVAVLWGGYYARYLIRVDARGITVRAVRSRFFPWQQLVSAQVEETDRQGIASCCITLTFSPGGTVHISSAMLELEAVQILARELQNGGLIGKKSGCKQ